MPPRAGCPTRPRPRHASGPAHRAPIAPMHAATPFSPAPLAHAATARARRYPTPTAVTHGGVHSAPLRAPPRLRAAAAGGPRAAHSLRAPHAPPAHAGAHGLRGRGVAGALCSRPRRVEHEDRKCRAYLPTTHRATPPQHSTVYPQCAACTRPPCPISPPRAPARPQGRSPRKARPTRAAVRRALQHREPPYVRLACPAPQGEALHPLHGWPPPRGMAACLVCIPSLSPSRLHPFDPRHSSTQQPSASRRRQARRRAGGGERRAFAWGAVRGSMCMLGMG